MNEIEFDINKLTKYFGIHNRDRFVKIYLRTHFRCYKKEDILIKSIIKTISHEELHILLRRLGIVYSKNEEMVFKRLQIFLYPELYGNRICK